MKKNERISTLILLFRKMLYRRYNHFFANSEKTFRLFKNDFLIFHEIEDHF